MSHDHSILPPYRYKPLREGEIRVLYVKPGGAFEAPIECVLRSGLPKGTHDSPECFGSVDGPPLADEPPPFPPGTTLDNAVVGVRYGALSYAWGPTQSDGSHLSYTVICEGHALSITARLDAFLRRMRCSIPARSPYPPPLQPLNYCDWDTSILYSIWIDAVCIDQNNLDEQSRQVQMMPTIYKTAITLLVWLGEASEEDESSLEEAYCYPNTAGAEKEVFVRLTSRPWFKRRWVLQEYLNSDYEKTRFWIGRLCFRGDYIHRTINMPNRRDEVLPHTMASLNGRRPLIWNLHLCQSCECSRPHDLVYALVHISSDFIARPFKVDYTLPLIDVFRSVAEMAILGPRDGDLNTLNGHNEHALGLLALATTRLGYRFRNWRVPHFPSWVPDWRSPIEYVAEEHKIAVHGNTAPSWPQPDRLRLSTVEVRRDHLLVRGEVMIICFSCDEQGSGPTGCRCCRLFGSQWIGWSDKLKTEMLHGKKDSNVIFVPEVVIPAKPGPVAARQRIAFVVTELAEASGCLELRYCFPVKDTQVWDDLRVSVVRIY